ncbi:hypothetical protein CDL15_Pgr014910 [Punica granatum]|uniref:Uncharacterized protein n=1 Tax=Punica granatum TaxID=22663 RepID=A0A218XZX1_PUNGR|nr:hypothetical protein CDL15_Pgr014910 [Punica granatum]
MAKGGSIVVGDSALIRRSFAPPRRRGPQSQLLAGRTWSSSAGLGWLSSAMAATRRPGGCDDTPPPLRFRRSVEVSLDGVVSRSPTGSRHLLAPSRSVRERGVNPQFLGSTQQRLAGFDPPRLDLAEVDQIRPDRCWLIRPGRRTPSTWIELPDPTICSPTTLAPIQLAPSISTAPAPIRSATSSLVCLIIPTVPVMD